MGIWIRSQDGITLAECSRITIDGRSTVVNKISEQQEYDCDKLGEYGSREEAISVIDKIQEFIKAGTRGSIQRESGSGWNGIENYGDIYQMPPKKSIE